MIRIRNLKVRFGSVLALEVTSLDLDPGGRLVIAGPNGSGKSTLLRVLAGLLPAPPGSVAGLLPPGRAVLVHQEPFFFRGTVLENLDWVLRQAGRASAESMEWLRRTGAEHLAGRPARGLSVGERRRLAVARALAVRPHLLLLDEPYAGVDTSHRQVITSELAAFQGGVFVTSHDPPDGTDQVIRLPAAGADR